MARLRSNFQRGSLTANIASGDTSISSAEFSALPVVASPDYLMIVLDPDAVHGNPEIVKVTAHTSSATSVTVVRAQEGTSARAHNSSTTWRHVPTSIDLNSIYQGGVYASRPAAGLPGAVYYATDTKQWFRDDGATWHEVLMADRVTFGTHNSAAGSGALAAAFSNLSDFSTDQTAFGYNALAAAASPTAASNTAFGSYALEACTGNQNCAFGTQALQSNIGDGPGSTGNSNNAFGDEALQALTTGNSNNAFGTQALEFSNGGQNSGFGHCVMRSATTGANNTAFGFQAGMSMTTGNNNVLVGWGAGLTGTALTTHSNNTFVGKDAGVIAAGTESSGAVALGYQAVVSNDNAVSIGIQAQATGASSTAIGNGASATAAGAVAIGADHTGGHCAVSQQDIIMFGTSWHQTCIGAASPNAGWTTGYPMMSAAANAPTGTPVAVSGFAAFRYDTTNHKIWVYDGGWKGVVVS